MEGTGEDDGTSQTEDNEETNNIEDKEEANSEPRTSEDIEQAQEDNKRRDSKLAETSKFSLSDGIPKRYVLLFLVFLGFVNIYGLRINLNVALVAMVNNRTYTKGGVTIKEPAEFHWNSKTQGKDLR
jgi:sugar phosphate permease